MGLTHGFCSFIAQIPTNHPLWSNCDHESHSPTVTGKACAICINLHKCPVKIQMSLPSQKLQEITCPRSHSCQVALLGSVSVSARGHPHYLSHSGIWLGYGVSASRVAMSSNDGEKRERLLQMPAVRALQQGSWRMVSLPQFYLYNGAMRPAGTENLWDTQGVQLSFLRGSTSPAAEHAR